MEIFWLVVALFTAGAAGVMVSNRGLANVDKMFLVFPLIAAALYAFRRKIRKRQEQEINK